jgi:hypothetical protein
MQYIEHEAAGITIMTKHGSLSQKKKQIPTPSYAYQLGLEAAWVLIHPPYPPHVLVGSGYRAMPFLPSLVFFLARPRSLHRSLAS